MTSDQFNAWVEAYNNAEIEQSDLDYDYSEWNVCISSDLPRAIQTAETIYPGPIIATNRLREIEVQSIHSLGNLKLHLRKRIGLQRSSPIIDSQLGSVSELQFIQYDREGIAHGSFADKQLLGNFSIRAA